jgi:DNA polymerase I-like protein with 3'-5' exonuclease and polymerase domains
MKQMHQPPIEHLTAVGKTKAIGLLSYPEIEAHGFTACGLKEAFNAKSGFVLRDLKTGDMLWDEELTEKRQTLAVAHIPKLQKLLNRHRELLQRTGWPVDAVSFFDRSLKDYVLRGTPDHNALQDLIKEAYGCKEKFSFKRCVSRVLRSVF